MCPRASYYRKNKEKLLDNQRKKRRLTHTCITFKLMMSGRVKRDSIWCDEHLRNCSECQAWYHNFKKEEKPEVFEGGNFWHETTQ
jgi:hypothetical protein